MDLTTLLNGLRGYDQVAPGDNLNTQATKLQQQAAVVEALRKKAMTNPTMGSMVSGHYVPNFAGLGQQAAAGMSLGGEESALNQALTANRQAQMADLQGALARMPEAPGDQSAGPPIPGALQDQQQGQFASTLLDNPITAKVGQKLLEKSLSGGFAAEAVDRAEKVADKAAERDFRMQYLKQVGEQNAARDQARSDAKLRELEAKAQMNPKGLSAKDYAKMTNDLGNRLGKEGKDYGEMVDAIDRVQSLVGEAAKTGQPLTASQADALIYAYNKVLDPHSVVREGEYARTTGQNPALDRAALYLNQVKDGKVVATPELAKQMLDTLNQYAAPSRQKLYQLSDNYAAQAKAAGVNPNFVVTKEGWRNPQNLGAYEEAAQEQGAPVSTGGQTSVAPGLTPMPTSFKDSQWDDLEQKFGGQYADQLRGIRLHGERSNSDQVSSADARTPYQITQKTRDLIKQKYGFDPWDGPENAIKGAVIVYKDGLNKGNGDPRKALDHYSGGANGYSDRVLKNTAKAQIEKTAPTKSVLSGQGWSVEVQ